MCKFAIKKMLKKNMEKLLILLQLLDIQEIWTSKLCSIKSRNNRLFQKSLALEYAKKNININCVSPGFIKTEMTDKINEEFKKILIDKIPSRRILEQEKMYQIV